MELHVLCIYIYVFYMYFVIRLITFAIQSDKLTLDYFMKSSFIARIMLFLFSG